MPPLIRVFYISAIVEPLTQVDVQAILGAAQMRNRRADVTGLLVQSAGHFAQVLEGRREAVEATLERVAKDPRHRAVRILLLETITRRQFDRWAMGWVHREEMTAEMIQMHEGGVISPASVREMIEMLLPLPH